MDVKPRINRAQGMQGSNRPGQDGGGDSENADEGKEGQRRQQVCLWLGERDQAWAVARGASSGCALASLPDTAAISCWYWLSRRWAATMSPLCKRSNR